MKKLSAFIIFFCVAAPISGTFALAVDDYNYPRVANVFLAPLRESHVDDLAKYDVLVFGMQEQHNSPDIIRAIRKKNPDIKILAYVSSNEMPVARLDEIEDAGGPWHKLYAGIEDDWWLLEAGGEHVSVWPGNYSINVDSGWKNYLPDFMHEEVMSTGLWDGIFYDSVWEDVSWINNGDMDMDRDGVIDDAVSLDSAWFSGMETMLSASRSFEGKNKIIVGNGGNGFKEYLNGRLLENFPELWPYEWDENFEKYYDFEKNGYLPMLAIINGAPKDNSRENYKTMRYGLATALLGSGFFSYDLGFEDHSQLWWYDEYNVALGEPLSSAYNTLNSTHPNKIQEGLWRRDFANGLVLVNSTNKKRVVSLEIGYEKITGTQDTEINNGKITAKVTIPAHDGLILLGRLAEITDVPYYNGSYAKVFNKKGRMLRNSFFSYNNDYYGGEQIIELPEKNKTIVAGSTYVSVYKNGVLIAKFAPYGTGYSGGVNISAGKLYKKRKAYYLVTGSKTGSNHVRIFSLKGKLKNSGCFPFGESFHGGVSVAVGGSKIIVGAGQGGGPQVMVLNNKCRAIRPGFFAYRSTNRYGVNVGAGDIDNDGKIEIVTSQGTGGKPLIKVYNKRGKRIVKKGFYAYNKSDTSGVMVGVADIDGNGINEIITSSYGVYNY